MVPHLFRFLAPTLAGAFVLLSTPTRAQDAATVSAPSISSIDLTEPPAHIALVDGSARVMRDATAEPATENTPVFAGDRLQTERGRVELRFADGSTIDVDEDTDLDLLADDLCRLLSGRIRVRLARPDGGVAPALADYRVDTGAASAILQAPGDYRMTVLADAVDLAVLRGLARLENAFGSAQVRAGLQVSAMAGRAPSAARIFNAASWDPFDRWVEDQQRARYAASSSRYLPSELRYYASTLDRAGSWSYEPAYGEVWYPRVDADWRPYSAGRWSFAARVGWLWIGAERWSWPTHHYGRWGLGRTNRWFWIPDRRWAPAWVSWGYAPGYITWCPLGITGSAAVSLAGFDYARGWSVVPAHVFRPNVTVPGYAVDPRLFGPSIRASVVVGSAAPVWRDDGRPTAPLRGPAARRGDPDRAPRDARPLIGRRSVPAASERDDLRRRTTVTVPPRLPTPLAPDAPLDRSRIVPRGWTERRPSGVIDPPARPGIERAPAPAGRSRRVDHPAARGPAVTRPALERPAVDRPAFEWAPGRPAPERPAPVRSLNRAVPRPVDRPLAGPPARRDSPGLSGSPGDSAPGPSRAVPDGRPRPPEGAAGRAVPRRGGNDR